MFLLQGLVILSALYWQYLVSLARWYGTWLGCALCKFAGLSGVVAAYVAFSVTALIQTMLYGWCSFFSIKMCSCLQLNGMQWTSHFFEVIIVASCNEYLSLPKKKKKKTS